MSKNGSAPEPHEEFDRPEPHEEFDRQVATLVAKGYPALAGRSAEEFRQLLAPLRERLPAPAAAGDARLPFLLVVGSELVPPEKAVPLIELGGRRGFTEMPADDLRRFRTVDGVGRPAGPVYLVVDVDTGADTLNVTPDDALPTIVGHGRSPLTIDEGIALATHHPEVLRTRNCFSLLGSRCGDRRVTAVWVSKGSPRLGWCWAGNPHTWLGSASCGARAAA